MSQIEIKVPDIGDFSNVPVIDVLVKEGEAIEVDTPLITLETEKATLDVPSTAAGKVKSLKVGKGAKVSKGDVILLLEVEGAAAAPKAQQASPALQAPAPKPAAPPPPPKQTTAPQPQPQTPAPTPQAPARTAGAPVDVQVPDIGDFSNVPVIEVLVKAGDAIEVDTPLITLETEKATMDVPSTVAGRVAAVKVQKGAKVSKGAVIVTVEPPAGSYEPTVRQPALSSAPSSPRGGGVQGEGAALVPSPAPAKTPSPQPSPPSVGEGTGTLAHASPSVRKFARELGVDLTRVAGSGVKGRITPEDVKAFVKKVMTGASSPAGGAGGLPKVPAVDFAKFGPVDIQPLGRIQRISGPRLHASWINVPHVTQFDQADITDMEQARVQLKGKAASQGIKLTPLAFVIRACARAIKEFPLFNTSLDAGGENLVHKKYLHIGFAADTPGGLVVPVIRDADRKDIYELARDLADLSAKARAGKLSGAEMQGGCFTVSSLGSIGGTAFTPIVNAPEVAILGVSRADYRPVYRDGAFVPRLILPLSLSYDHRVIDGALGVRFTTYLAQALADVRGLLEAIP